MSDLFPAVLIRDVRLVPIGARGANSAPTAPTAPTSLRIRGGVVTEVAPGLKPTSGEHVLDGQDRWAIPGLWDHHVHLRQWGLKFSRLDTAGTGAPDEVLRRVATHVAALPTGDDRLVEGFGHRLATWDRGPTVSELDAVSGAHPVVLISGDGHNGWLNSRALALLGAPPTDGALDEDDWYPVWTRLRSLPGAPEQDTHAYAAGVTAAAALGIVGVTDMEFDDNPFAWPARFAAGVDGLRVRTATYADGLADVIAHGLRTGDPLPGGQGLLTMGPLKIISDGSLSTRTAHCFEPYADAAGTAALADPAASLEHWRGKQNLSPAELTDLMGQATRAGIELAIHAIGDAAVAIALDAFAAVRAHGSIEHAQLLADGHATRMARLGVRASVQPAHLLDDRDVTMRCWPDRSGRCFPFRDMLNAGVTVALGSDAPVSPLDPWLAMAAAVHRSADERAPWHPEQALTVAEALAASTDGRGTLGVGSLGDVVLLDADPQGADAADSAAAAAYLRRMPVAATLLAGRATYLSL
ncbi:MAG: amidohydrolase family protein [Actinomycetales bacterium]|nr:amidohydrolase family protein [Actinomycetales bacterium]